MKTISKEEYTAKCIEVVRQASKWLTENVDLTDDLKIHCYGLNIWSDLGGESPIRIVVTNSCGCVNGVFVKDPYMRWHSLDEIGGDVQPGRGSEGSIRECAENIVASWKNIVSLVEKHNSRIRNVINFNIK